MDTYPFLVHWYASSDSGQSVHGKTEVFLSEAEVETIDGNPDWFDERINEAFETLIMATERDDWSVPPNTTAEYAFNGSGPVETNMLATWIQLAEVEDFEPLSQRSEEIWIRLGYPPLKQPGFRY